MKQSRLLEAPLIQEADGELNYNHALHLFVKKMEIIDENVYKKFLGGCHQLLLIHDAQKLSSKKHQF